MSKGTFNELFQDYVCSCVLRVANELLALLPVERVIVTATDRILNTGTGHVEEQPIASALVPRATLEYLDLLRIDPSDAFTNFVHRMRFKKTAGFAPIEPLTTQDAEQLRSS